MGADGKEVACLYARRGGSRTCTYELGHTSGAAPARQCFCEHGYFAIIRNGKDSLLYHKFAIDHGLVTTSYESHTTETSRAWYSTYSRSIKFAERDTSS